MFHHLFQENSEDITFPGHLDNFATLHAWAAEKCVPLVREITFENAEVSFDFKKILGYFIFNTSVCNVNILYWILAISCTMRLLSNYMYKFTIGYLYIQTCY